MELFKFLSNTSLSLHISDFICLQNFASHYFYSTMPIYIYSTINYFLRNVKLITRMKIFFTFQN